MLSVPSFVAAVCGVLSTVYVTAMSASVGHSTSERLPRPVADSLVITSPDSFSTKSLRELLVEEVKRAHALKRTPFLELGAPWCGPCQELQKLMDTKPTNPVVLDEFSNTYIIRLNVDTWKREFAAIGFSGQGIPMFLSIDTTGTVTDSTSADQWGAITPEALRTVQAFFKAHAWHYDAPTSPRYPATIATIPMLVDHGMTFVTATVDGQTGLWLLDTGVPWTVLNNRYLQRAPDGTIAEAPDTTATPATLGWSVDSSGSATVCQDAPCAPTDMLPLTIHTVQIGMVTLHPDSLFLIGPAISQNALLGPQHSSLRRVHRRVLGHLGTSTFAHTELILDYRRNQITLIPLDAQGTRAVPMPRFSPKHVLTLTHTTDDGQQYGIHATLGGRIDADFLLDTGNWVNTVENALRSTLGSQLHAASPSHDGLDTTFTLNQFRIGDTIFPVVFTHGKETDPNPANVLGYPFFKRAGIVGFNFDMHTFTLY
jgi:hypothetical protein